MNPVADIAQDEPNLVTLLERHCLTPDGKPADHARGLLADLRKLLSPATQCQGLFALGRLGFTAWDRDRASLLVAGLFGLYPQRVGKWRNFGTTCRELACRSQGRPGDSPFDRQFRRILASRTIDEIAPPVLAAGRMAKAEGKAIHFGALHRDLKRFQREPDPVLEAWAQSYFETREPAAEATDSPPCP